MRVQELKIVYANTGGDRRTLTRPQDAVAVLAPILEREAVEVMGVLWLTTKHQIIGYHELGRGVLDSCLVHPRDVFKIALLANAAGIILGHNHPSGDPAPSADDLTLTRRLTEAGRLLGIDLLDHVIIGHTGRFTSLREAGHLSS